MTTKIAINRLPCTTVQAEDIAQAADLTGYLEEIENTNSPEDTLYIARGKTATVTVKPEGNGWTHILDAEAQNPQDPQEYEKFVDNLWDQYLNRAFNREQNREILATHVERSCTGQCECQDRLRSVQTPEVARS